LRPSRRECGRGGADGSGERPEIPRGKTLDELGYDMMKVAERVVDDAEEFMALFPEEIKALFLEASARRRVGVGRWREG
jgi:hypothetical protein